MLVPILWPQFASALAMSILLFSMVFETDANARLLQALAVFVLFWVSIACYAWAHNRVSKTVS